MEGRASSPPLRGIVPGSSSRQNEAAAPESATGTMPVAGGLEARPPRAENNRGYGGPFQPAPAGHRARQQFAPE